jgi:UDP-N-acetylmuramoylalanine--D-glutamate ligase
MDTYLAAKLRIFERQSPEDICIVPAVADFLSAFVPSGRRSVFGWGKISVPENGLGIWCDSDGNVLIKDTHGEVLNLINRSNLLIPGDHNVENSMVAVLLALHGGASLDAIRCGLGTYRGLAHRLVLCGEKNGVKVYNDSKGTNVDATLTAIKALSGPLVLLLGGEDKGSSYAPLREALVGKLRHLVFLGDAVPMLEKDLGDLPHFSCKDFDGAVACALDTSMSGDQVLLSPACASFDQFKNFEARGERFEYLVSEWQSSK